jgi:murein peptide amidase A
MRLGVGLAVVALAAGVAGAALAASGESDAGGGDGGAAQQLAIGPAQTFLLGRSVRGRPIQATELGDPGAARKMLVIGVVHGNETAGRAVARALVAAGAPPGVDLWVVEVLNPDGVAAGTRQNARGVDLNRNFPWRWRSNGARGDPEYPGPHVLSEPESRIAYRLIRRLRPRITIWFHQPLALVDESGGRLALERRYANDVGLPLRRLTRYHGSASSWQNTHLRGTSAFVVELPRGALPAAQVERHRDAVLALAQP